MGPIAFERSLAPWAKATYAAVIICNQTKMRSTPVNPPFSLSKSYFLRIHHRIMLATKPMANARMRLLMGNHAFSAHGLKTPFSLTGSQSYLFAIQPLDSAFPKNPFRALNCSARPRTKKVGNAKIGANHFDLSIGLSASKIAIRTTVNERNAMIPPISGLATQDMTTF